MIVKPESMTFSDKTFSMIIYGAPGVGKTTLALSAPSPILIDFDHGISRVKAYHRKDTMMCATYEEVLSDIKSPDMKDYKTIVIDTGGSFVSYLQDWAMRDNPATNKMKNGSISLKGFGAVKQEFQRFTSYIKDILNKNVIYIFHSDEQKDKDGIPQQRLLCEGAARNIVWQPCDFGGYIQMIGEKRVISFTPTQEYFAKGCYGIEGTFNIPTLSQEDKNDFVSNLFETAKKNINKENEIFAPLKEKYKKAMEEAKSIIDEVETSEDATKAVLLVSALEHSLTSKKESSVLLSEKAKSLGFVWDKEEKAYKAGQ